MSPPLPLSGALLIDKPKDLTSSDVVTKLKWAFINHGYAEKGFRIGHGGTLDPFATGVLAVLFGEATKLADCYLHSVKAYSGVITLGASTDTGDHTGKVLTECTVPPLSVADWQSLAQTFVLEPYEQTPPMYSAKKKDGRPLHELARKGVEIEREPILKRINQFLISLKNPSELEFQVTCESGTYVRVLAEDLAKKAGTLAHLKELRRTRSSDLHLERCMPLDSTLRLIESKPPLHELPQFISMKDLASHLPAIEISPEQSQSIRQGHQITIGQILRKADAENSTSRYLMVKSGGYPLALLERPSAETPFRLQRVFNQS